MLNELHQQTLGRPAVGAEKIEKRVRIGVFLAFVFVEHRRNRFLAHEPCVGRIENRHLGVQVSLREETRKQPPAE